MKTLSTLLLVSIAVSTIFAAKAFKTASQTIPKGNGNLHTQQRFDAVFCAPISPSPTNHYEPTVDTNSQELLRETNRQLEREQVAAYSEAQHRHKQGLVEAAAEQEVGRIRLARQQANRHVIFETVTADLEQWSASNQATLRRELDGARSRVASQKAGSEARHQQGSARFTREIEERNANRRDQHDSLTNLVFTLAASEGTTPNTKPQQQSIAGEMPSKLVTPQARRNQHGATGSWQASPVANSCAVSKRQDSPLPLKLMDKAIENYGPCCGHSNDCSRLPLPCWTPNQNGSCIKHDYDLNSCQRPFWDRRDACVRKANRDFAKESDSVIIRSVFGIWGMEPLIGK